MPKKRLDVLLVERALTESREKAQRLILAGQVLVAGQVATKPGHTFDPDIAVELKSLPRFVSRGGDKLEAAFVTLGLNVEGQVCLDVGASTGGFTDCLLQHGAARVYAVDVGKGQLHWKLRNDPRVVILDQVNARYLKPEDCPETPTRAVVDVSFISLTKVLPAVIPVLARSAHIVALIKPQFEAGRDQVEKGGVVRNGEVRRGVIEKMRAWAESEAKLKWQGGCDSPLAGPAGNREFLAYWKKE